MDGSLRFCVRTHHVTGLRIDGLGQRSWICREYNRREVFHVIKGFTKQYVQALAPYIAVLLFWCVWPNAWLAILAYHAQILLWNRDRLRKRRLPRSRQYFLLACPAVLTGPLVYVLLPVITRTDLVAWLATYHLSGPSLILMIPYFGVVHPVLEQRHWNPLREHGARFHFVFAGYHMIVLWPLLTLPGLMLCFGVLAGASFAWTWLCRKSQGLTVPVISHIFADLGVILATWASIR